MVKRLGVGLLEGLIVGLLLGAGFQLGLRFDRTPGLLGFLLAMGTGATAGIVCGKPPWRGGGWLEPALKSVFGLGVGALLFWGGSTFLSAPVPFALPGTAAETPWVEMPLLLLPVISTLYGAIVELDNTDRPGRGKGGAALPDEDEIEGAIGGLPRARRR